MEAELTARTGGIVTVTVVPRLLLLAMVKRPPCSSVRWSAIGNSYGCPNASLCNDFREITDCLKAGFHCGFAYDKVNGLGANCLLHRGKLFANFSQKKLTAAALTF
jgi:hypothetical protein